ncbi:ran binding protein 1 [Babesia ovis]|uniref:Ran binding protein 1 n=1 Tax=Babesia ovis TaxID=5869 RepID=A0A9W5TAX4_BABOV|nr:ran binding protein 1 [Babesia ovis]
MAEETKEVSGVKETSESVDSSKEVEDGTSKGDTASTKPETPEEPEEEEEVVEGNWNTRKVEVKEIQVITGEEDEEIFWQQRSKLYRFGTDTDGEPVWKERGLGESKLLQHKTTKKIRFLLRQDKTLKVVANHYVLETESLCRLRPNIGSDKIWVWTANNTYDDETKVEQMALKFGQIDQAKLFKEKFEEAAKINKEIFQAEGKKC